VAAEAGHRDTLTHTLTHSLNTHTHTHTHAYTHTDAHTHTHTHTQLKLGIKTHEGIPKAADANLLPPLWECKTA